MKSRPVALLPSLCTLANALCGLAAITFLWKAFTDAPETSALMPPDLLKAGYFILLGMVFDALDGRLARFARATSDFGGHLDSVADAVTFGVAPAFLMNRVVVESLKTEMPPELSGVLRVTWVCAAVYLACALIRLARFNSENAHEEEAHRSFKGLPSPAAAGTLVSLVIVLAALWGKGVAPEARQALLYIMPPSALLLGILMVSNVRYVHLVNLLARGRRTVGHLVGVLLVMALCVLLIHLLNHVVLLVGFAAYTLSGPLMAVWPRARQAGETDAEPETMADEP